MVETTDLQRYSKRERQRYQGRGLGGEEWLCLECAERLYGREDEGVEFDPADQVPHPLSRARIFAEKRLFRRWQSTYNVRSAYIYGVNLWVALARYHWYTTDPQNIAQLDQLNNSRRPYVIFPDGLFIHPEAPALFTDLATLNARGRNRNGRIQEVAWEDIQYQKLSVAMDIMADLGVEVGRLEYLGKPSLVLWQYLR